MAEKIPVTDAAIERCRKWFLNRFGTNHSIDTTREMLDAALNPPQGPEIIITDEMTLAGVAALKTSNTACAASDWYSEKAKEVYRAMKRLEPKLIPQVLFEGFKDGKLLWSVRMLEERLCRGGVPHER